MMYNLIKKQLFSKEIKSIFYFSCSSDNLDLTWHDSLQNIAVSYLQGLPTDQFLATIPPNSIIILDDISEDAIESATIARAFKVQSRHQKFSIALITQSIFEKGKWAKCIRLNTEVFILFNNYG